MTMARKRKESDALLTEVQTRARRAIVDGKVTKEIIRDAFLEGRDEVAVEMMREMDGKSHARAGAAAIKRAETGLREMPPSCYGAIARLRDVAENVGVASAHLDQLPHEMRAPNSKLFGRRNALHGRVQHAVQTLQSSCNAQDPNPGAVGSAFTALVGRDPRDGIPYGDVPLEGKRRRR
jgi:hypothetical protein